ncbi:hypothetical protein Tco_1049812, partial [Tanacetum coccineum]
MLQARENLMEAIQAFLKKYDQIPPKEKSMALLLAEERFLKIKQALEEEHNQPENIQELQLKLINDLQILNGIQLKREEQAVVRIYQEKDKNKAKTDKAEHGNGKRMNNRGRRRTHTLRTNPGPLNGP